MRDFLSFGGVLAVPIDWHTAYFFFVGVVVVVLFFEGIRRMGRD